jgi:sporulation protein YlmC with PRC-barrel domain
MRNVWGLAAVVALTLIAVPSFAGSADESAQETQPSQQSPGVATELGTATTVLHNQEVQSILGKEVRSIAGEDMGRIVDVLVDRGGQIRAAVIDFGGFLGVGSRKIVVDWSALHFAPGSKPDYITADLTRDQVKAAPEYKNGRPVVVIGALNPWSSPGM